MRPKSRLPGSLELGRLIDERQRQTGSGLELRHSSAALPLPPQGSIAQTDTDSPPFPERFVESVGKSPGGTARSGLIGLLEGIDSTLRIEDVSDSESSGFRFLSVSMLSVVELPVTGAAELIYRRSMDNTLWWDRSSGGDWTQLDVNGLDHLVKTSAADLSSGHLVEKIAAGQGITLSVLDSAGEESLEIASLWRMEGESITPADNAHQLFISAEGGASAISTTAENGSALLAETSGSGSAITAIANEGAAGVFSSIESHAAVFSTLANEAFSVYAAESCFLGSYADLHESSSAPPAPSAGSQRLFADASGILCMRASSGAVHDLCVSQACCFPAASGRSGSGSAASHVLLSWGAAAFPASASAASVSASGNNSSFSMPTGAGFSTMGDCFARFEWTSSSSGIPGSITTGAQLAVGHCLRRSGNRLILRSRVRVNNKNRFSNLELAICDSGSNSAGSGNLLSSLNAGVWHEIELGPLDITGWQSAIRLLLSAQGTTDPADTGLSQVDIEYLEVRSWAA